jgi:UDP-glucose 6-dehydrogenase
VVCVDCDAAKIETLRAGRMPSCEPSLLELATKNVKAGWLGFVYRRNWSMTNGWLHFWQTL